VINIKIPHSFMSNEIDYTIEVVFKEFLGINYKIETVGEGVLIISHQGSDKELKIHSVFFKNSLMSKMDLSSLPPLPLSKLNCSALELGPLFDTIPILYGNDLVFSTDDSITLGIDIFGSIFYMLSRFEELVVDKRDNHDRFPAVQSLAFKEGFLERPIVDEYIELLWACMKSLWPEMQRTKRLPKMLVSCDVDQPFDTTIKKLSSLIRTCSGDLIKRRSFREAAYRLRRYACNKLGDYRFDSNYTFDWYMDSCERAGLKVSFYFIPSSIEANNGEYELAESGIENLLLKIHSRGHEIGVHGSYQTYLDGTKLLEQKMMLESTLKRIGINQIIKGNRQHYLRWSSEVTPELLEKAGFEYDSTGGYADRAGFRYGTAHEFSMWGWQSRKKLTLKQRPLIVMENTIIEDCYMGLGKGEVCIERVRGLNAAASMYNGNFSLLWHNSSLGTGLDKELFLQCIPGAATS